MSLHMFLKKDLPRHGLELDLKEEIGLSVILLSMEDLLLLDMFINSEVRKLFFFERKK
jgi:hypothetical protein